MPEAERKQEHEIATLLAQAQHPDAAEDVQYAKGARADELLAGLARRESGVATIRGGIAVLEAEAKVADRRCQAERTGRKPKGRPLRVPDPAEATPDAEAQRNLTSPDSRIMKDDATKSFVRAYIGTRSGV